MEQVCGHGASAEVFCEGRKRVFLPQVPKLGTHISFPYADVSQNTRVIRPRVILMGLG